MFSHHFPQSLVFSLLCLHSHVLRDVIQVVFWWNNRRHCRSANNNLLFHIEFVACSPSKSQALVSFLSVKWQRNQRRSILFLVLRDVFGVAFQSPTLSIWQWQFNISVEVEFVVCFPSEFKHWYVYRVRNDREPNGEIWKSLVSCEPVDYKFRARKCRGLCCSYKLGCVGNYASFSDLVLFQLKRMCPQKFKKS